MPAILRFKAYSGAGGSDDRSKIELQYDYHKEQNKLTVILPETQNPGDRFS